MAARLANLNSLLRTASSRVQTPPLSTSRHPFHARSSRFHGPAVTSLRVRAPLPLIRTPTCTALSPLHPSVTRTIPCSSSAMSSSAPKKRARKNTDGDDTSNGNASSPAATAASRDKEFHDHPKGDGSETRPRRQRSGNGSKTNGGDGGAAPSATSRNDDHSGSDDANDDADGHGQNESHPASHQAGTGTEGKHEWKMRAPYRLHEPNEHFDVKYDAACHCGRVKYQLSREEPLDSKLCHCTTCQTQHAAPFQWAAIFHKTDINFLSGHHDLEWYDPTSKSLDHKLPCKVRCSYCHSPVMDEGRNMILLFPSLVHFRSDADRALWRPRCHMFYGQRVVDVPDGLPKWSGLNEDSELMEDSPPSKVQEVERRLEEERRERFEKGENK